MKIKRATILAFILFMLSSLLLYAAEPGNGSSCSAEAYCTLGGFRSGLAECHIQCGAGEAAVCYGVPDGGAFCFCSYGGLKTKESSDPCPMAPQPAD